MILPDWRLGPARFHDDGQANGVRAVVFPSCRGNGSYIAGEARRKVYLPFLVVREWNF